ncbi:PEP-CTERM sorting domain-containing protein [Bryobacter aggregatus]|uniref:PEP-CTERM sorting domain-containing protein n=1 Tax=Bryobacter aggregatus TaxID=360054 RepID=UPI000567FDFC|nr:PEP-CTERM sorting domain-containing protein [Bryobacter aggregatus]
MFSRQIGLSLLALTLTANAATLVVDPNNPQGWTYGKSLTSDGSVKLVVGPDIPPLGSGSLNLNSGTDGSLLTYAGINSYDGLLLSDLQGLSYSTYGTSWNGAQLTYLKIWIDWNGDGTSDDALYFEPEYQRPDYSNLIPNQGAPVLDQWQTWNVFAGGFWTDFDFGPGANVNTLSNYLALHPNAKLATDKDYGAIRFTVGAASPGDVFNAYIDNVTITFSGNSTTFDFEGVPEPGSWALMGAGLALLMQRIRSQK